MTSFWLLLLLLLVSYLYAAGETLLVSLTDTVIEQEASTGDGFYIRVRRLLKKPGLFVTRMKLGQVTAEIFAVLIASVSYADRLAALAAGEPGHVALRNLFIFAVTIVVILVFQIFGNQLPKLIARQNSERQARILIHVIRFLNWLIAPLAGMIGGLSTTIARLARLRTSHATRQVTMEELRMMADIADESGQIENWQNKLIGRVLDLGDTEAGEIMTHRTRIEGLEVDMGINQIMEKLIGQKYSRLPVYEERLDNIVGILYIKDLIYELMRNGGQIDPKTFSISTLLRTPMFVPEGKQVTDLLEEMQLKHEQMAIIIDEYGGTAGLVTIEDILEELVGNLQDEYDEEAAEVVLLGDGSYRVEGKTDLETVSREVPFAEFSEEEEDDFDTLAGLVLALLGYIPEAGEITELVHNGMRIKIQLVKDNHIAQLRLWPQENNKLEAGKQNEQEG